MNSIKRQIGFGDWAVPKKLPKYLKNILKTRRLTYGPYTEKLEKLFCEMNGVKYAVFCSSGTAALYTSIGVLRNLYPEQALKKKYIVLPSTTFVSDHNVVVMSGFEPLYVDVGANYNIAYADLENVLKSHSKEIFAVMPSSLMGRPVDGARIKHLIETFAPEAFFILDSCENICSKHSGHYPEASADFTAWSTYISHLLISGAAGGFIGTSNEKFAIYARSFINHGRSPEYTNIDQDNNVDEATLRDITAKRFHFIQNGLNFRLGEVEAAFALSMLEEDFIGQLNKRTQNAYKLMQGLSQLPLIIPKFPENEECRHMMLPIRVATGTRENLVNFLECNGIETRPILPLVMQPITKTYFGNERQIKTNFPMSWEIYEKGLYVSCHPYLSDEDIDYMIDIFHKFFKMNR